MRALTSGGYADLDQVHTGNRDFVRNSPSGQRHEALARGIDNAPRFMRARGVDPAELRTAEFCSSHEALLLDYEAALTRTGSRSGDPYDVSAHKLWTGERTRRLDGAHVGLASRIRDPIGGKPGPAAASDDALALTDRLGPYREPGRLTPSPAWEPTASATARPHRGEGQRRRGAGRLGLRPHARQHLQGGQRAQAPALRRRPRRGPGLLRGPPGPGHPPRRRRVPPPGADLSRGSGPPPPRRAAR
ncbi:hypothetical protein ABH917_001817 [Thermobifida halotolerans]